MSPETRNQAVERIMNVQAANAAQRHALANDTPDPADSVSELLARAYALVDKRPAEAKTLIRAAFRLTQEALSHGDAEDPELREAAALVDAPEAWTKHSIYNATTGPLGVLGNPILKHDEARATVLSVIAAAGVKLTGSLEHPDLRNLGKQLGKAKYGRLLTLVAEYQAGARS